MTKPTKAAAGDTKSLVEQKALERSAWTSWQFGPEEKIPTIVVPNFPALGKLAALRFLEWVLENPRGVISLPTGKTPEFFIRWVKEYLSRWHEDVTQEDLKDNGIDSKTRPDLSELTFVQIDEFYPIDPAQHNSFFYYVNQFYINGFGLNSNNALLINCEQIGLEEGQALDSIWPQKHVDLTLRYRQAKSHLEERQQKTLQRIDQWCQEYEDRIRSLGGIGFFLGGIGPDGHIGFNIAGSDHHCTTRLCDVNYETQAASATDMGGIETARKSLVITIGLETITYNRDCCAVIIASGEAKAPIVQKAIEHETDVTVPASALRKLPGARFYITEGAGKKLMHRQCERIASKGELTEGQRDQILYDLSHSQQIPLTELTAQTVEESPIGRLLMDKSKGDIAQMAQGARKRLIDKIERGINRHKNTRFLHTEPHHDDVMLGYFASVVRNIRDATNTHHFMTLTSGFTSVTNEFMLEQVRNLRGFVRNRSFLSLLDEGYFSPKNQIARNRDVWQYLDGAAARKEEVKHEGCARRLLRNLFELYDDSFSLNIEKRLEELEAYFVSRYPGQKDIEHIQRLKGMCREWEAECLWGYFGWNCDNVHHLRLGFYTGDIFTKEPSLETDVPPIVQSLEQIEPDIITVAFDPESSGPDTHYKVLQAIAEAVKIHEKKTGRRDLKIWGYRNVWYRFDLSDVNQLVPVSLNMFSIMQEAFLNAFLSQKQASFPSYEHDGPFCELAQSIQVGQYQAIKSALGREWFYDSESPLIRATRGFVYLKEMDTKEFYHSCRELKKTIENSK